MLHHYYRIQLKLKMGPKSSMVSKDEDIYATVCTDAISISFPPTMEHIMYNFSCQNCCVRYSSVGVATFPAYFRDRQSSAWPWSLGDLASCLFAHPYVRYTRLDITDNIGWTYSVILCYFAYLIHLVIICQSYRSIVVNLLVQKSTAQ